MASKLGLLGLRKLVGLRLEGVRNSRNETLSKVAEATGVSRRTIRKIEKNEVNWKIVAVYRLCKHYGINQSVLYDERHRKIKI